MIFCKNNIYDRHQKRIAAEILIQTDKPGANLEEEELLTNFIDTIAQEFDKSAGCAFQLIFPYEHRDKIANLDESILKRICLRIDANEYQHFDSSVSNKLIFELKESKDIKVIPKDIDTIIIDNELIEQFEPTLDIIKKKYNLIIVNIATHEQLNQLMKKDIQYFEGHFIETPRKVEQSQIPANKITVLNLISILNDPDTELYELSEIITTDNLLSYKLLRIVNSPIFRGVNEIVSIHEAIIRFGFANLKKWVLMLSLCNMSDKPMALVELTLQRAVMCHRLAKSKDFDIKPEVCYTVGLLSTLDAFVDHPMESLLVDTPLTDEIKEAILYYKGTIGQVLDKVIRYQRGEEVTKEDDMTQIYIESANEVKEIFETLRMS